MCFELGTATVEIVSRTGDVAHTLTDIDQERGANAIVDGRRGAGRIEALFLGSVAQKLVNVANWAVVVVP